MTPHRGTDGQPRTPVNSERPPPDAPPTYSYDDRLDILRALATSDGVRAAFSDHEFKACDAPPEALTLGFVSFGTSRTGGPLRALDLVQAVDHPKLLLQLNAARTRGVGSAVIRLTASLHDPVGLETGRPLTTGATKRASGEVVDHVEALHVIDMREHWGVVVWAFGGPKREISQLRSTAPTPMPKRVIQHRDHTSRIVWVDEHNERLLGWTSEQMVGESALNFVLGPDHDRAIRGWIAMLASEPEEPARIRYLTASGDHRWLEVALDNRLETDGYIEVELIDVHDEMTALAQARTGEAQFQVLTDSLPVGVIQVDADGRVIYSNRWMRDKLGAIDGGGEGHVHPDDLEAHRAAFRTVIATGDPVNIDTRLITGAGVEHRCRSRIRSLGSSETGDPLGAIASVEDMTETMDLQEQLEHQAQTDFLTGLPNRAALMDWLQVQLRPSASGHIAGTTVLFFDLDGFKRVNDGLGHEAGDKLLRVVADRITEVVRPTDLLARIGGDEFVIACNDVLSHDACVSLAERVLRCFDEPIIVADVAADVGCSVGIARSDESGSAEEVLGNADIAMYEAKRAGGRQWSLYQDGLRDRLETQFQTESEIRRGLILEEFRLFLQPVVDLGTGLTVGAEALIRWEHPDHGLIEPAEFIPAAERSGLIRQLGLWVIEDSCLIAARAAHQFAGPCRIAINLSGRQFMTTDFREDIVAIVERVGVDPRQLILEVTETAFIDTSDEIMFALRDLADLGFTIALDDFGTGYSSLNHLRLMPAKVVKIDHTFTADLGVDPGTTAITEAMVGLSRDLGHELIVEGVEHQHQLERLRAMGVTRGQGYLLARPMPEAEFFAVDRTRVPVPAITPTGVSSSG